MKNRKALNIFNSLDLAKYCTSKANKTILTDVQAIMRYICLFVIEDIEVKPTNGIHNQFIKSQHFSKAKLICANASP